MGVMVRCPHILCPYSVYDTWCTEFSLISRLCDYKHESIDGRFGIIES